MNILKNLFFFNKKSEINKEFSPGLVDQSLEIAKLDVHVNGLFK